MRVARAAPPPTATALHYGQACFEGLKAFRMADGRIRIFRPHLNAQRLQASCAGACMPAPPVNLFLAAVRRVVAANADWVPPYGAGAGSLYIRPFVIGSGAALGLHPPTECSFLLFVDPVGNYYKGGRLAGPLARCGVRPLF
jgi:branched-chain amino acid aminotransferase